MKVKIRKVMTETIVHFRTLRKDLEQYFGTTCVGVKYKDSVENIVAKEQELNLRRVI